MRKFLLILAVFCTFVAALYDCDNLNCSPCATGYDSVDIAFLLDASGSMGDNIALVKTGLTQFVQNLQTRGLASRFAIILFGMRPEVVLDWTSSVQTTIDSFDKIQSNVEVAGFSERHYSREAGFEAIQMALCQAPNNSLVRTFVGGDGCLKWKNGALKYLIIVTDEDADCPYFKDNYDPLGLSGGEENGRYGDSSPPAQIDPGTGWWMDRENTGNAFAATTAYATFLVNTGDVPTSIQYCDPAKQVQNQDFSGFDGISTISEYDRAGNTQNVQYKMLKAGLDSRCFDITEITNNDFIANFFGAIAESTGLCESETSCFNATCDINIGCTYSPICKLGCDNCLIDNTCYSIIDQNPNNPCESCDPGKDQWRGCYDGDACTEDVCTSTGCEFNQICSVECGKCDIPGVGCIDSSEFNPDDNCQWCQPLENPTAWSDITFIPGCGTQTAACTNIYDSGCDYDADGDGTPNSIDNCPLVYQDTQGVDTDNDGVGDICDICAKSPDDGQNCGWDKNTLVQCSGNGKCICADGLNPTRCECDDGFYGKLCESPVVCPNDCTGRGNCTVDGLGVACICEDGWDSDNCGRASLCPSGCVYGTCVKDLNCVCDENYYGFACEYANKCGDNFDCGGYGNCTNSYTCECEEGYEANDNKGCVEKGSNGNNNGNELEGYAVPLFANILLLLLALM